LLVFRCKVKDSGRQDTHTETEREGERRGDLERVLTSSLPGTELAYKSGTKGDSTTSRATNSIGR